LEDTFAHFEEDDRPEDAFFAEVEKRKQRLDSLQGMIAEVTDEYRAALKRDDAARRAASDETLRLNTRLIELNGEFAAELRELEDYIGVPDEVFEEIAAAKRPPREERYWRAEVEATPPSGDLDALAESGLRHLLKGVDRSWLEAEARKPFRLSEEIFGSPMQFVGSVRVGPQTAGPQRFAKMLLVTADHLGKHDRLDFIEALPYTHRLARTRVFAPNYMEAVFGWRPNEEWDGIVCEVDPADSLVVERARCPRALRWVSRSDVALRKKARGVTSLWGDAMLQIPAGDMGFIYIAYSEVNRESVADARTREIMDASARWTHRWSISLGTTVINRLYPRAVGVGNPDIIESAMPIAPNGDEYFVDLVPTCVFTHAAEAQSNDEVAVVRDRAVAMLLERSKRGR
jgi:hypothetical protein